IISSIILISDNRPPPITMAWILSFLALPLVGIGVYIFFGRAVQLSSPRLHVIAQNTNTDLLQRIRPLIARQQELSAAINSDKSRHQTQRRMIEMGRRTGLSILTAGDNVEILQDAREKYPRLEADI